MLAQAGSAFDSDDYYFEIKWDGTRELAFVESESHRLINRRQNDRTAQYPELEALARLPSGTIVDGEIVVADSDGKPSFPAALSREQARGEIQIRERAHSTPAIFMAFDLLYFGGESVMASPLEDRRERLEQLVRALDSPHFLLSDGVQGRGLAFFDEVTRQGLEGVVAKRLSSPYLAGRRTDHWIKIKPVREIPCVIFGFLPDGQSDVRSLCIAAERDGLLRSVGRVGSGLTAKDRRELRTLLDPLAIDQPAVPETHREAIWVQPKLFCRVQYLEETESGDLRGPVFKGLVNT